MEDELIYLGYCDDDANSYELNELYYERWLQEWEEYQKEEELLRQDENKQFMLEIEEREQELEEFLKAEQYFGALHL